MHCCWCTIHSNYCYLLQFPNRLLLVCLDGNPDLKLNFFISGYPSRYLSRVTWGIRRLQYITILNFKVSNYIHLSPFFQHYLFSISSSLSWSIVKHSFDLQQESSKRLQSTSPNVDLSRTRRRRGLRPSTTELLVQMDLRI